MGKIPQEIIDQILDRADIVEIVSEYLPLKKAGRNFRACCPFHNEKTPSFVVSADKQIYHCFGCSAGGNVIGFVMALENLSFPEAIRMVGEKIGVEVPRFETEKSREVENISTRLYEINNIAASFYQNNLRKPEGKHALEYFKKRGISNETLSLFRLGYALEDWETLKKYCISKKVPDV